MLVLQRKTLKPDQRIGSKNDHSRIVLPQLGVEIVVVESTKGRCKIAIKAPRDIDIVRGELLAEEGDQ